MSDKAIAVGLVGAGVWGRAYIRTIDRMPGVELAMLASSHPESAGLVRPGCVLRSEWRDLVSADVIDGLIVATPPASHAEIASEGIEAGKAVLVEKPLTLSVSEARSLLDTARRHNAFVMVDHTHLYHPAFESLVERLRNANATVTSIIANAGADGPFRHDTSVLWDWGPHDIAMCLAVLGCLPVGIHAARLEQRDTERGCGETVQIELEFSAGQAASITVSNLLAAKQRRFEVDTRGATYTYDDQSEPNLAILDKATDRLESVAVDPVMPLTRVVETFAEGIRRGSQDRTGLEMGADIVAILATCQQQLDSAVSGDPR
ncbi:MAG: Gfo/Idh/MocA family oxidoreductase [Acidobacteriota bacterium]|nr:Gfo/Idh/MocA family oxidoreductase [Acidobacteriota bacterium]